METSYFPSIFSSQLKHRLKKYYKQEVSSQHPVQSVVKISETIHIFAKFK